MSCFKTLLVVLGIVHFSIGQVQKTSIFRSVSGCSQDFILASYSSRAVSTTEMACSRQCSKTSGCMAFNLCPLQSSLSAGLECQPLSEMANNSCPKLSFKKGCSFRERDITCHHGKINASSLRCDCFPGFVGQSCNRYIMDCTEGRSTGLTGFVGNQTIQPLGSPRPFQVLCGYDFGITHIIFRKRTCSDYADLFQQNWQTLKEPQGDCNCNCFIGLENMYHLLKQGNYRMKLSLNTDLGSVSRFYYSFAMKGEQDSYALSFSYSASYSSPNADDGFPALVPFVFCSFDRDCNYCATATGHAGWFSVVSNACDAVYGLDSLLTWPVNGTLINADHFSLEVVRM